MDESTLAIMGRRMGELVARRLAPFATEIAGLGGRLDLVAAGLAEIGQRMVALEARQPEKGEPGRDGAPGLQGERGEPGPQGEPGRDGADGQPGQPGKDGAPGEPGADGKDGEPGRDGVEGQQGERGEPGQRGADGQSFVHRGSHDEGEQYDAGDVVTHNRGSWVAICDDPGPLPGGGWRILVQPGDRGGRGQPGKDGRDGASIADLVPRQDDPLVVDAVLTDGTVLSVRFPLEEMIRLALETLERATEATLAERAAGLLDAREAARDGTPIGRYRRAWAAGLRCHEGDVARLGRELWIALRETSAQPGPGAADWELFMYGGGQ